MKKEYRMAAFVPRWGIAPRHHQQSLAEHSFYVALYASHICQMLDISKADRIMVVDTALRHDIKEVWESDIPGPAKRSIIDPQREAEYHAKFAENMDELYQLYNRDPTLNIERCTDEGVEVIEIRRIIKVADLMDEVFYLAVEMQLGNNLIRGLYQHSLSRLDQAATNLAGDEFAETLMQAVGVEVARLGEEGARIPANNEDLKR